MDFEQLVKVRRSCRDYGNDRPSKEDIEEIISTTLLAPSWENREPGKYYVALSDDAIAYIYDTLPDFNKTASKNSAYIIATYKKGLSGCLKENEYADELKDQWGAYDLGLQNSYLMLKASDMGYDTLVMGLRDVDKIRKYFSIPEDEIIMPVIAIGKKKKELSFAKRKDIKEVLNTK